MKKLAAVTVALVLCLGLVQGGASHAAEKTLKLEFSSYLPPQSDMRKVMDDWCKEIEKRTNGAVVITHHPGATLTSMPQTYEAVMNRIVDIGFGGIGYTPGRFPMMEAVEMPYGNKSASMSARLANDFYKKFKPKELANTKVLFLTTTAPVVIHTKKPIKSLEDLNGLKIRVTGGPALQMLKALGAIPVVISVPDTYDAISKGVADGVLSLFDPLVALRWGEVVKYSVLSYGSAPLGCQYLVMNKEIFNSMPANVQRIMDEVSSEYERKIAKTFDDQEGQAIKTLTAAKHTITTLSKEEEEKWAQKIAPIHELYVKEKSSRGLPASEAVQFCRDWVKTNQK